MALFQAEAARELGNKLADHRARLGLTQDAAAKRVGVSLRAYSRWESGDAVPRDRNVYALAKVFNIDPAELLIPALPPSLNGQPAGQLDRIEAKLDQVLGLLARRT